MLDLLSSVVLTSLSYLLLERLNDDLQRERPSCLLAGVLERLYQLFAVCLFRAVEQPPICIFFICFLNIHDFIFNLLLHLVWRVNCVVLDVEGKDS